MYFHHYSVGSQTVILGKDCEKDVLEIQTYLYEENMLLLHDALCAPRVQCFLVYFVYEISFRLYVLDIVYNSNLFGYATLKGDFDVLDKARYLPSLPHFQLCFEAC